MAQQLLGKAAAKAPRGTVEAAALVLSEVSEQPRLAPFLTRALNALAQMARRVSERDLVEAASATSDYEALVQALASSGSLDLIRGERSGEEASLVPARIRGLLNRQHLLAAEGGAASVGEVARLLGISRQAVDKRRREGKLIGLATGRRGYLYPLWQLDRAGTLPGLETVLKELRGHDPWMQLAFMLNGNIWLGGDRPLDALRRGQVDAVAHAARAYGEHGSA